MLLSHSCSHLLSKYIQRYYDYEYSSEQIQWLAERFLLLYIKDIRSTYRFANHNAIDMMELTKDYKRQGWPQFPCLTAKKSPPEVARGRYKGHTPTQQAFLWKIGSRLNIFWQSPCRSKQRISSSTTNFSIRTQILGLRHFLTPLIIIFFIEV